MINKKTFISKEWQYLLTENVTSLSQGDASKTYGKNDVDDKLSTEKCKSN